MQSEVLEFRAECMRPFCLDMGLFPKVCQQVQSTFRKELALQSYLGI